MQIRCPRPIGNSPHFLVIAIAAFLGLTEIAAAEQTADSPSASGTILEDDAGGQVSSDNPFSFLSRLNISGYLKNETAFRFDEPRSVTKIRNIFYLKTEYPFGSWGGFTFSGWAYHDLVYDLFDYQTISGRSVRN